MSQAPYGQTPAGPPNWPAPEPSSSRGHSRLPIISSVGIALVAVAIAIGSWFRPSPTPDAPPLKTYSSQEVADAKKAVCGAYDEIRAMLEINSSNTGSNDVETQIVAVNTRLAIHVAGDYLNRKLADQPATPTEIAKEIRALANTYETIAVNQLGQVGRTKLDASYAAAELHSANTSKVCSE